MAILHISFKVKLIKNKVEQMKLSFLTSAMELFFLRNDFMLEMEETKSSNGWYERVTFWRVYSTRPILFEMVIGYLTQISNRLL
jgi:hypothetical protein